MTLETAFLGPWLAALFYLLGGVYLAVSLVQRLMPKPAAEERYVSKPMCSRHMAEIERRIEVLERQHLAIQTKISNDVSNLHARVDRLTESNSKLTGRIDTLIDTVNREAHR